MNINTDNPIIKFSGKGKPFQYDKLLYATLNDYILEYKNARLDKLTDQDASICLARIIRKLEVNDVPVQQFFHEELEGWTEAEFSNYGKILKLCEVMANDMFCCFDKNRSDEYGNFAKVDRIYCVNNDGVRDYITCEDTMKKGLFKKVLTPEAEYFKDLMERNSRGELPKSK